MDGCGRASNRWPWIAQNGWLWVAQRTTAYGDFALSRISHYDSPMSFSNRTRRRQSYNIKGHAHELTFSCYRKYPFLKADRCCQWLAETIELARNKHDFSLWAFVFMPDHVHLIIHPRGDTYKISRILETIKRPVGVKAIRYLESISSPWLPRLTRKRGSRTERLFWQSGGGYDRNITCPKTLLRMIDYLHDNPLRKSLVTDALAWHWSSARCYAGGDSPIPIDPIPPEWLIVDT
jgi:putative transposase